MKKLCLLVILLSSLICHKAYAWEFRPFNDWDKTEKALFASNCVLRTVDMLQTNDIYARKDEGYYEMNPLIDAGVDKFGTKFIPVWFITGTIAEYLIVDAMPHPWRKAALGVFNAVSIGLIYNNHQKGLGLNFSF